MTRFEHHVTRGAQVTCGPAGPPGTHEIRIVDGAVTVVLRFGSAEEMAAFSMIPYRYVWAQTQPSVSVVDTAETVSTGVWGQGSAGAPVGESGEAGIVATTRALPADPDTSVAWGSRTPRYPFVEGFNPAAPADPPTWPRDGI